LLEKRAKKLIYPLDFFLLQKRHKNKFIISIPISLCAKRYIKQFQHKEILSGEGHQLLLEKRAKKLLCPVDFFLLEEKGIKIHLSCPFCSPYVLKEIKKNIQHEEILSGEGHQLLLEKRAKKLICPVDFFLLK